VLGGGFTSEERAVEAVEDSEVDGGSGEADEGRRLCLEEDEEAYLRDIRCVVNVDRKTPLAIALLSKILRLFTTNNAGEEREETLSRNSRPEE
jgi:hypothetical protein